MVRKIPKSKRHKKIKQVDPFYKGDRTTPWDKNVVGSNCKPSNPDHQEIPRKVLELMNFSTMLKENKINRKGQMKKSSQESPAVKVKERPIFKKRPRESEDQFMKRINARTKSIIATSKLEKKFDVTIREDREGNVMVEKGVMDKDLGIDNKKLKEKKKLKRKKREEKIKAKKLAFSESKKDDFGHLQDKVKFGEVVIQPPTIGVLPRKSSSAPKAGCKKLLLMDKLRNECKEVSKKSIFDPSLTFPEVNRVDRTVKRKLLSVSDRRKLDAEKDRVVQAYRLLKAANKHKNQKNKIK